MKRTARQRGPCPAQARCPARSALGTLVKRLFIIYDKEMAASGLSSDLRHLRKMQGMPLSRLARLVGTSSATISRYESGWSRFELTTLRKLATALGYRIEITWRPLRQSGAWETEEQLIRKLGRLFWDRRLERGDVDRYPRWMVGRVIQYGKIADIQALCAFLGRERFIGIISDHRMPSAKLERFWNAMLRLEGVSCTKKPSRPQASISWPV